MGQGIDVNITSSPNAVSTPTAVGVRRKRKVRVRVRRLPAIEQISGRVLIIVLLALFLSLSVLLIFQRTTINRLDERIDALSEEYDDLAGINDDLRVSIMSSRNIGQIERYAREDLGMVKAEADDYELVIYPPLPAAEATPETVGFWEKLFGFVKNIL